MINLLKEHFGYDTFRPLQEEIINSVLAGQDSFVLMPTGGGKSLCYQLPALKLPGLTLVISPLIALMKDQVDALQANGIEAEFINSSLPSEQINIIIQKVKRGEVKLLYVAPERFALQHFQDFLLSLDVSLIAVDEAHCISEWGHDFRPDYRNLSILKKIFPSIPLIALTATATSRVKSDILNHLNILRAKKFVASFNRENLHLSVIEKKKAFPKLVNLLQNYKNESVIIYCFSRKETEEIADNLKLNGFKAGAYHAGLETVKRKQMQEAFTNDKIDIIVATIAFGMGIDKPDVRLVVHYTFPKTLENYYQEIGRAGRDGLKSDCVMFYTYADLRKHEYFANQIEDQRLQEQTMVKLGEVLNYGELSTCRKKYLLKYFGEEMDGDNCGSCDTCLEEKETFDATEISQKIMSAILRTDSRFGKKYIIDVLLGRKIQKIKINNHDKLSVFGLCKQEGEYQLGNIIKQLLDRDYLHKSEGKYPIISLTRLGGGALKNNEKIILNKLKDDISSVQKNVDELEYSQELFDVLRDLRKHLADEAKVPPFVIFGDKSLQEMAYYLPSDKENFNKITGVGAKKLEQYADVFLELINAFSQDRGLESIEIPHDTEVVVTVNSKVRQKFYRKTKELLDKQIPINRIAKKQEIKFDTVVNHIEKLIDAGEKINIEYLKLPLDRYEVISLAFQKCGNERLKPVFEYLEEKYSYDEIKLARVLMRA